MNYKKILSLVFAIVLLNIATAQDVPSRKYHGIVIEPAVRAMAVSPGESLTGSIRLTNDYQDKPSILLYPYVMNFRQHGETGNAELYTPENIEVNRNAASWITFKEQTYNINFGNSVESNFLITAPADAINGGYYIALVYSPADLTTQDQTITIGDAIGCLIFLTVRGNNVEKTDVLQFYSGQSLYDAPPVDMFIRVSNTGNVHATIGGNIFIHQGDLTKPTETLEVNPENYFVLPGSNRTYESKIDKGFIYYENGQLKVDLTKHFYFGQYTATLKLRHMVDNQKVTDEREIKFWIIPWKLILILIVAIIVVVVVFKMISKGIKKVTRKIFKKKKNDQAAK